MINKPNRNEDRKKRHLRVRKKISGTTQRPRLNVYRSSTNIYAQVIDDINGVTLAAASSLDPQIKEATSASGNKETAKLVGKLIGERALEKGITEVIFDRGGYIYHGRVKELSQAAREAGLKF
ncbi:50S ribosomal protein L18 [Irregularibacter muris]|uniref:Large ribosomal subunit protein uL18 n=1 Tax=Irregularibacter muris TaxID=1796619 RepID=A0AAE3KZR3_9FIRM|nr:50S ribosomal protein L18 [Irregularibacter muris]MCR1898652.1 50S ribosomal protein L18 [Irregularibacter muris]